MPSKLTILDFVERTTATFVQAFLAIALITGISDVKALEAAGLAGAIAAGKYVYIRLNAYLGTRAAKS